MGTAPYLLVADIQRAAAYFRDVLGFAVPGLWGDPPVFCMPVRDGFVVMLKQVDSRAVRPNHLVTPDAPWDVYVWVRDVDALCSEYRSRGASIEYGPVFQDEYGLREFAVRTPDGHVIAFGQPDRSDGPR